MSKDDTPVSGNPADVAEYQRLAQFTHDHGHQDQITATLTLCPRCQDGLVVIDGEVRSQVTFWVRDGQPMATSHADDCSLRGRAIP